MVAVMDAIPRSATEACKFDGDVNTATIWYIALRSVLSSTPAKNSYLDSYLDSIGYLQIALSEDSTQIA